ncbi:hypothetical protein BaRGS_00003420 [Batillaria attramentaria]|uniref:Uncharacterized protein n=1 Tax=Batillaria attramentaria TaxID=370345 RepID=A0ABD0M1H4_9CAEN
MGLSKRVGVGESGARRQQGLEVTLQIRVFGNGQKRGDPRLCHKLNGQSFIGREYCKLPVLQSAPVKVSPALPYP